ncbi:hypothetical protein L1049_023338 [Liquidambar formosana]|uniref:Uncharacterized protein n=1 Tax=Liquidambar formosana TaxID=63359 RepID=A0AAP0X415_LIQFO
MTKEQINPSRSTIRRLYNIRPTAVSHGISSLQLLLLLSTALPFAIAQEGTESSGRPVRTGRELQPFNGGHHLRLRLRLLHHWLLLRIPPPVHRGLCRRRSRQSSGRGKIPSFCGRTQTRSDPEFSGVHILCSERPQDRQGSARMRRVLERIRRRRLAPVATEMRSRVSS